VGYPLAYGIETGLELELVLESDPEIFLQFIGDASNLINSGLNDTQIMIYVCDI